MTPFLWGNNPRRDPLFVGVYTTKHRFQSFRRILDSFPHKNGVARAPASPSVEDPVSVFYMLVLPKK